MSTPIWLLDIDGVLNAVQAEPREGYVSANTGNGPVRYRPALTKRITALHEAGLVEIRWLTTWMHRAEHLAVAAGLPCGLDVEGERWFRTARADEWWKSETAREIAEGNTGRLLIWTDDDLDYCYNSGELYWVNRPAMVLISPDPQVGLTDADLDAIEHACRAVRALFAAAPVAAGGVA